MATMTAKEMIESLKEGTLQVPVMLTGMVKLLDIQAGTFLFSAGTACLNWVEIHADSVEKVETLRTVTCKDHSHPLVVLTMKAAGAGDTQATAMLRLVNHLNDEMVSARAALADATTASKPQPQPWRSRSRNGFPDADCSADCRDGCSDRFKTGTPRWQQCVSSCERHC
ncbi:hypothetical protein [Limnoglobus roseus]|uniref:Uncharacterized protein n=1 Tax=Limnoglobus roseus TaxID=2598579 RepID=A0A5C1AG38_9BACT|nr:hypothetical protein [Limnoglobus roseus]QEL17595.1 hypothetical protein PX52LOC_04591 [Limnoglobus roseus]